MALQLLRVASQKCKSSSLPPSNFGIASLVLITAALLLLGALSAGAQSGGISLSASLPPGTVGTPYSGVITASGGSGPYQYAVVDGRLPRGLILSSSGAVSGTPSTAEIHYFKVQASDSNGLTYVVRFAITVGSTSTSAISVSVSPASSTLPSSGSEQLSAYVSGTSNTAVNWAATTGSITNSGMYTAPKVSANTSARVVATSVADPTKTASAVVAITASQGTPPPPPPPPGPVSVSITPNSATVSSGQSRQFTVLVNNTANQAVTWTASAGSVSSSGLFTAPTVTSNTSAMVTATSVADTTKSAQAAITVSAAVTPPPPPPPPGPSPAPQPGPSGADNRYCSPGDVPNFGAASDNVATLPTACFNTALASTPSPGSVIQVQAGGSLQNAINAAACGDTIMVQAGATFSGTFSLPAKGCDDLHWVTIRTSASNSSLPPEGTRLTPCYAGLASLPDRPAYSCPSPANVMPTILAGGNQAFITASGASHYRLIGLEITHPSGMQIGQPDTLVAITNTSTGQLPDHVIIDRCWVHGLPTAFAKRGVKLDGNYLAIIDSTVTDIHAVGTATQGIQSGTGTGPLKIVNNFVEGGDSAVGFGGQPNPFGNPADIEIRRNHMFKPLSWQYGSATYLGYAFSAKVALESKNSNRVLVEGNIMEHAWGDQQGGPSQGGDGSISWLGPKNQGGACPTCDVSDITIRYNVVSHAGAGFYIFDAPSDTGAIALQAQRYSIHDNVADDISTTWSRNGSGGGILNRFFGTSTYAPPRNVSIFHNTGVVSGGSNGFLQLGAIGWQGFVFQDNIEMNGQYGISGCQGLMGVQMMAACAPNAVVHNNLVIGTVRVNLPTGNFNVANPTSVFASYNGGIGGDYRLCQGPGNPIPACTSTSQYVNAGTDGRDLGADIKVVATETAGVN